MVQLRPMALKLRIVRLRKHRALSQDNFADVYTRQILANTEAIDVADVL